MKRVILIGGVLALLASPAWPAGGGGDGGGSGATATAVDPDFRSGLQAWQGKDWPLVLVSMGKVTQREPNNADAWNYMGHASRQLGDMSKAFEYYEQALRIDPKHRGAHEYMGEAYLMVGNLAQAEVHLKALDKLCFLPCKEYSDLKEDVQRYRREHSM